MDNISFGEFKKLDIRIGKILSTDPIEGSEKLLKLEVDTGDEKRQIIAGIAKAYEPDEIVGRSFVILVNLEPRKLMGLESQGMLLCADAKNCPVCLAPIKEVPPGIKIL
ncbi:MAG: methionine--tRNA ligase subunit beta [Candidatus Woykebacteria bacterium RIFCSPLOWO2_01_FULL_41_12]|uniref:Methionine--tRNA ligase n=1 Tax=Candidatus Woykebacteria bacterium RIFCSPLOWO2_01_FULL_41_12 TaxID=1802604 RepID=A0A1G1WYL9_9BACT|nr:MAG: methionine--tRNA ligase subunit beta [Candidatus Woykebacteria bacterium RIFCSPLOWO2_01_FULL_41_12]